MFTQSLVATGYIPSGFAYTWLPTTQLLVAVSEVTSGLDYKSSAFAAIGLSQAVLDPILIFLIGRRFVGSRVGLVSALVLSGAAHYLSFGVVLIPNTFANTLALFAVYLVVGSNPAVRLRYVWLLLLVCGAIVLTHALTPVILLAVLTSITVFKRLDALSHRVQPEAGMFVHRPKPGLGVGLSLIVVVAVETLAWWSFASGNLSNLAFAIKWGFRADIVSGVDPTRWRSYLNYVPIPEQILAVASFLIFSGLATGGFFILLWSHKAHPAARELAIGGMTLLLVGVVAQVAVFYLLWDRWFYFAEVLLSIPAGVFLAALARSGGRTMTGVVAAILMTGMFAAAISPNVNNDFYELTPHVTTRYALLDSELAALEFASTESNATVFGDRYLHQVRFSGLLGDRFGVADQAFANRSYRSLEGGIVVVREYVTAHPVFTDRGVYYLGYNPAKDLSSSGWSLIYDSGSTTLLVYW